MDEEIAITIGIREKSFQISPPLSSVKNHVEILSEELVYMLLISHCINSTTTSFLVCSKTDVEETHLSFSNAHQPRANQILRGYS